MSRSVARNGSCPNSLVMLVPGLVDKSGHKSHIKADFGVKYLFLKFFFKNFEKKFGSINLVVLPLHSLLGRGL